MIASTRSVTRWVAGLANPVIQDVRKQYEEFPYPPISPFALPRRGEGERVKIGYGARLGGLSAPVKPRILVAGAGSFEALVVAQANPDATEVVAVDLSSRSLASLRRRLLMHRLARPFSKRAPVRLVRADLFEWSPDEAFDFILASNVLHHVPDPAALLARLASWLKPDGLMRVVTYPRVSRIWMRETGRFLRTQGIGPGDDVLRRSREAIASLPVNDPKSSCFESHEEAGTATGIVDAFLHACENPLSPLEWEQAFARAGLEVFGEDQNETSRSDFLVELMPACSALTRFERLQVLDDLLELCANPVFWLKKTGRPVAVATACAVYESTSVQWELRQAIEDAERILAKVGVTVDALVEILRKEVGLRVSAPPEERPLPGLSITEYRLAELRTATRRDE